MNPLLTFRIALRALLRNKLRSFLTTLGISIGVAAVIATVAIGEGAKAKVEQAFAALGTNLLIVIPGSTTAGGSRGGFGSQLTLTWDDLRAIQSELPAIKIAAPVLRAVTQVLSEDQNWTTQVQGTTPEYFEIRNWPVSSGVPLSQSDVEAGSKVAVLGQTVVKQLFGANADPVGQTVRIKSTPFEVVGVLAAKGQSLMGQDYDDGVYIPVHTFQTRIQNGLQKFLNGVVFVSAISLERTAIADLQVTNLLRDRHHVAPGADDDFSIRNLAEIAGAQQEGTRTLTTLLASIAAVSLLVGGIGIMNIMLVSVTERTREIGVRMAMGAKPHHILAQFLVEALALAVIGGFIGVAFGVGTGTLISSRFGWPMLLRLDVIVISVVFSAMVGVVFGLYPARKASRLDPIEALRYE